MLSSFRGQETFRTAAATAGLPERIGGDKNYDYRFAWVRDAAYTIKALLRAGAPSEPIAAFGRLVRTIEADGTEPKVGYTLRATRCQMKSGSKCRAIAAPRR